MSRNESKHVQTELDAEEYEAFREFAEERGLTVKEAGREALMRWVESQRHADPHDRAFTVLDELDDDSLPSTAETDARTADDPIDEWTGDDVAFSLADDPSSER